MKRFFCTLTLLWFLNPGLALAAWTDDFQAESDSYGLDVAVESALSNNVSGGDILAFIVANSAKFQARSGMIALFCAGADQSYVRTSAEKLGIPNADISVALEQSIAKCPDKIALSGRDVAAGPPSAATSASVPDRQLPFGNPDYLISSSVVAAGVAVWGAGASFGSPSSSPAATQPANTAPTQPTAGAAPQTIWQPLPGKALDVGIAANGTAWAVGLDSGIYRWDGAKWNQIQGAGVHIAVAPDGNAWVIARDGTIWRFDGQSFTRQKAPKASAIDIGANGDVWIVDDHQMMLKWNPDGSWSKRSGKGSAIAVAPDGNPWVLLRGGSIAQLAGNRFNAIPGPKAMDIGISADGTVWVTDAQQKIHRRTGNTWELIPGQAVTIAGAGGGKAWVITQNNEIFAMR
ncbi:MAG: hypothetical protein COS35_00620 [Zetaproteobacteria bacterium CG02_land_8_20_14_3_00_50_9]|nr:MAG: hypothetical protein COS35_00620 [Zetaproteobacteria bacterium CG02_land_8_20_14_3_00_50_9]